MTQLLFSSQSETDPLTREPEATKPADPNNFVLLAPARSKQQPSRSKRESHDLVLLVPARGQHLPWTLRVGFAWRSVIFILGIVVALAAGWLILNRLNAATGRVLLTPIVEPPVLRIKAPSVVDFPAEAEAARRREALRESYQTYMAETYPQLRNIGATIEKTEKGYALWATHEYFSQESLQQAGDAEAVRRWLEKDLRAVKQLKLEQVGLKSTRASLGSTAFEIE